MQVIFVLILRERGPHRIRSIGFKRQSKYFFEWHSRSVNESMLFPDGVVLFILGDLAIII